MMKIKYVSRLAFMPDELDGMKEYLERQAQKGWFPDPFYSKMGLVMRRGQPRSVTYYVTYADSGDPGSRYGVWQYIGEFVHVRIFAAGPMQEAPPKASCQTQFQAAKNAILFKNMPMLAMALPPFWLYIILSLLKPENILVDRRDLIQFLSIALMALSVLAVMIREGLWVLRNGLRMRRGEAAHYYGIRHARIRCLILTAAALSILMGSGYGQNPAVFYIGIGAVFTALLPALYTVMLNISCFFRVKSGRNFQGGYTIRWIIAAGMLILAVYCTHMTISGKMRWERTPVHSDWFRQHSLFQDDGYRWSSTYHAEVSGSVLASRKRGYIEALEDEPASVLVTVYSSPYPAVRQLLSSLRLKEMDRGFALRQHNDYIKGSIHVREYGYTQVWAAGLQGGSPAGYRIFILEKGNEIIRLECMKDLQGDRVLAGALIDRMDAGTE